VLALVLVTALAYFLVERIEDVVEFGVPDQFLGLILLPFVEKAAEHLTAVDEAWDGQIVCRSTDCISCFKFHLLTILELRTLPLYWPLHPNRPIQRTTSRHRWLDHGQRYGSQL